MHLFQDNMPLTESMLKDLYFEYDNHLERILHPNEILNAILIEAPNLDNEASNQFKDDMNNSVANMAISLSYQSITLSQNNEPLLELIINAKDSYLRLKTLLLKVIHYIQVRNYVKVCHQK